MLARLRTLPEPPPTFSPSPGWARSTALAEDAENAAFFAGAALSVIHPIAMSEHPLGILWRQRLALTGAEAVVRLQGRNEDAATLRDHWYLTRKGDDPGPAGRMLRAWRELGRHSSSFATCPSTRVAELLQIPLDDALQTAIGVAVEISAGKGSPVAAAASVAATSLRLRPDSRPLALWLADAVLARRLSWPAPVPLLAAHLKRGEFRLAQTNDGRSAPWMAACSLAYAHAAAASSDLYADLARRAGRLLAIAPKLRGKDADATVALLLCEDAQPARSGRTASDRSSRRLFERLVELGGVRELTGRATFRLYGL